MISPITKASKLLDKMWSKFMLTDLPSADPGKRYNSPKIRGPSEILMKIRDELHD